MLELCRLSNLPGVEFLSNRDDGALLIVGGGVLGGALVVWQFSQLFNLDFATSGAVLGRAVLTVMVWGLAFWLLRPPVSEVWPLVLASLWLCCWPALDYWSDPAPSNDIFKGFKEPAWYAMWYTKWGVLGALGLIYGIRR